MRKKTESTLSVERQTPGYTSSSKTAASYQLSARHFVALLGAVEVDELDTPLIYERTAPLRNRPYAFNRMCGWSSQLWTRWAPLWGLTGLGNPWMPIPREKERARIECLTSDQRRDVSRVSRMLLSTLPGASTTGAAIIGALNETGCRPGELQGLECRDVDLTTRTLTLRSTKERPDTGRRVPLSEEAAEFIGASMAQGYRYVFPGRHGRGHITDIRPPWRRVLEILGLPYVRPYVMRHSAVSAFVEVGDYALGGEAAGHQDEKTTKRYTHLRTKHYRHVVELGASSRGEVSTDA